LEKEDDRGSNPKGLILWTEQRELDKRAGGGEQGQLLSSCCNRKEGEIGEVMAERKKDCAVKQKRVFDFLSITGLARGSLVDSCQSQKSGEQKAEVAAERCNEEESKLSIDLLSSSKVCWFDERIRVSSLIRRLEAFIERVWFFALSTKGFSRTGVFFAVRLRVCGDSRESDGAGGCEVGRRNSDGAC